MVLVALVRVVNQRRRSPTEPKEVRRASNAVEEGMESVKHNKTVIARNVVPMVSIAVVKMIKVLPTVIERVVR